MALTHYGVNLRQCYVLTFCYQQPRYGGILTIRSHNGDMSHLQPNILGLYVS